MRKLRALVLYAVGGPAHLLSYQVGWPKAFARHSCFDATVVNVYRDRLRTSLLRARRGRYDAIVLLHSVFSNGLLLPPWLFGAIKRNPAVKAYFVGNEYKLMPEKMEFAERLDVKLLVSMTWNPEVHGLYRDRLGAAVVNIPSGGLDPDVFFPATDFSDRPVDLGFRAADEPLYFGHQERRGIADYFSANAGRLGLSVDVSLDHGGRMTREEYAAFLNRCRGQLATEGGTEYFDLHDETRFRVTRYVEANPEATLDEVRRDVLFAVSDPVSARMLTGRQVEAAGTKTVQLQFEGNYGGVLEPDVHYIPLRKDLSNAEEAVAKFRDDAYCRRLVDSAYEVALSELTYEHLIDRFHAALEPLAA